MQSCCVVGCESYKQAKTMKIAYFKFPLNDRKLLSEWVKQIGYNNWQPSEQDQICSAHFENEDIDEQQNCISKFKYPCLKPNAIPTIFPLKRISLQIREIPSSSIPNLTKFENHKQCNLLEKQTNTSQLRSITLIPSQNQSKQTLSNQLIQLTPIIPNQIKYIISEHSTATQVHRLVDTSKHELISNSNNIKLQPHKLNVSKLNSPRSILKLNLNKQQIQLISGDAAPSSNEILPFVEILKNKSNIQNQIKNPNVMNLQKSQLIISSPNTTHLSNIKKPTEPIILRKRKYNCTQTLTNKEISINNESPTEKTTIPSITTIKLQSISTRAQEHCDKLRKNLSALEARYQEEKQNIQKFHELINSNERIQKSVQKDIEDSKIIKTIDSENLNDEKQLEKLLQDLKQLKKRVLVPQDDHPNQRSEMRFDQKKCKMVEVDESKNVTNDYNNGEIIGEINEDIEYLFETIDDEESTNIAIIPNDKIDAREF